MLKLLVVYIHLLATCSALGAILATDLRLLCKLAGYRVRIAPPNGFVTRLVGLSLALLVLTGAALIGLGLMERPDFFTGNPKLQAKVLLVATLAVNAFVLHRFTFPRLARGRRVTLASLPDALSVAVPVALSNCLWLFIAFLGIARPWSYVMPFGQVLSITAALFSFTLIGVLLMLAIAARKHPSPRRDWIDNLKTRLRTLQAVLNV
jgi:hypothetical protein